jgi:hypothetical protein
MHRAGPFFFFGYLWRSLDDFSHTAHPFGGGVFLVQQDLIDSVPPFIPPTKWMGIPVTNLARSDALETFQ